MTVEQWTLFAILFVVFVFLIWGRWRYDLVAFTALVVAIVAGVVPVHDAFSGFGHPATVIVGLVLIVSRALFNSGAIELIARFVVSGTRRLTMHIAVMSGLVAALSAVINNVAALALFIPLDLEAAAKAERSPALTLMPLSFASILGGMITLIGTPPNIVISEIRNASLGAPFEMFDFSPVGLVCTVAGVAFIALVGWRLIPAERGKHITTTELMDLEGYIAELKIGEESEVAGKRVAELDDAAAEHGVGILGLIRGSTRMPGLARRVEIKPGDVLVIKASPDGIERMAGALKLEIGGTVADQSRWAGEDMSLIEVAVPPGARAEGRSARAMRLTYRHGVALIGVSRQGQRFTDRVQTLAIQAGDVLLLLGPNELLPETANWLGGLPLADRGLQVIQRRRAWLAVGIFAAAIAVASAGWVPLVAALAAAAAAMVLANIVPLRQVYESVEWPVIVLLGSMIPIGAALQDTGGTVLIADTIIAAAHGQSPVFVLVLLMIVTMTLSDVMNNTATAVIAAPIAITLAHRLDVNPDSFLMAVAVAASAAFLTPIGHKNNTLILGPGGYRFGDYWRMGLPLEVLIVAVSVPTILAVWPL
jgi:di/tricarboxylate transporter